MGLRVLRRGWAARVDSELRRSIFEAAEGEGERELISYLLHRHVQPRKGPRKAAQGRKWLKIEVTGSSV